MAVIFSQPFFIWTWASHYAPNMEHYFPYNLSSGKTIVNRCCQMKDKEIRRMSQATRLMEADFDSITTEDVVTVKAEDIAETMAKPKEKRRIGFVA